MKKFSEFITEATTNKVIYVEGELWVTYSQGSGQTIYLPDLSRYLNSDSSDKEHFDSLVSKLSKYSKDNKPMKQNNTGNVRLFEIPTYPISKNGTYDIWGGEIKPTSRIYMVVTEEKSTIVNFFKNKNEAINWLKSIV